jgi:AraC-like DNA-binding protein
MPRREILTSPQRTQLLAFPDDEGELIRRYTLTKADLAFVRQHRGDHIVEIAYALGFPSQAHFTSIFGKLVGTTPADYRKRR